MNSTTCMYQHKLIHHYNCGLPVQTSCLVLPNFSHLYFDHTRKRKKYESSIMFLCEAGKIKNSKLEFYDLKPSEFKDLKKKSPVS